jgi:dienelactone hydrolase
MNIRFFFIQMTLLMTLSCIASQSAYAASDNKQPDFVIIDSSTQREIPIHVTFPSLPSAKKGKRSAPPTKVALLSGGYNQDSQDSYLAYSYLSNALNAEGYAVFSVQHELKEDAPIAMEGDIYKLRLPVWERGVQNLEVARASLRKAYPKLDWKKVLLIGHSHGGDISSLYAQQYPKTVSALITLDNRRMPLPRDGKVDILSLRSSDKPADKGVLPDAKSAKIPQLTIVKLKGVRHGDMSDEGISEAKKKIVDEVVQFLK